jgi:hypothetical protein
MHVLDRLGVVSQNSKIVNGVTVNGVAVDFLMVVKDTVAPKGTSANDVTVGQDVSVKTD